MLKQSVLNIKMAEICGNLEDVSEMVPVEMN